MTIEDNAEEIVKLYKEAYNMFTGQNISDSMDIAFRRYRDKMSDLSDGQVGIEREMNNSNIARGTYTIYLMAEPEILAILNPYLHSEDMKNED